MTPKEMTMTEEQQAAVDHFQKCTLALRALQDQERGLASALADAKHAAAMAEIDADFASKNLRRVFMPTKA